MAKFVIPLSSLPPPNEDGNHLFRFRIASEDKTRTSPYSNLYVVKADGQIFPRSGSSFKVLKGTATTPTTIAWEMPTSYNFGSQAAQAAKTLRPVRALIVSSSVANIDVSGIVPNIYKFSELGMGMASYKFYNPVSRQDANNVIDKLLQIPGVAFAEIDELVPTPRIKAPTDQTKWGILDVDIFIATFASASVSASPQYTYYGRTRESQFSTILGTSGSARVIAQVASYPPQINSNYTIFDTGNINLAS